MVKGFNFCSTHCYFIIQTMAECQCNNYYIKINLLKPSGNFTYYQVEQISAWCSHSIYVFVWILKQTVTKKLVYITKMESVYCAVCTESLYKQVCFTFKGLAATTNIIITFFLKEPSHCVSSNIYYISTVNSQHMQRPDVLLQLGYTWRHVSAVKRPSSGQHRLVLLRYSQNCCPMGSHCLH